MKTGAMGAAGLPIPDQATVHALVSAFASQAAVEVWDTATSNRVTTVSMAAESPSIEHPGEAAIYRLIVSCSSATRQGDMQLAWSPMPRRGTLFAARDGEPPVRYEVNGTEKMGNGDPFESGPAAVHLYEAIRIPLPAKTLAVSNLFPDQTVAFRFDNLSSTARKALSACQAD